jgi:hypothetical protein
MTSRSIDIQWNLTQGDIRSHLLQIRLYPSISFRYLQSFGFEQHRYHHPLHRDSDKGGSKQNCYDYLRKGKPAFLSLRAVDKSPFESIVKKHLKSLGLDRRQKIDSQIPPAGNLGI